jgi:DNA-binding NarL/FixJ family response regulator
LTLNPYDKRTVAEGVNYVRYTPFPWQAFWMPPEVAETIELQQAQQALLESQEPAGESAPKRNLTPRQLAIMRARSKAKTAASSGP